MMLPMVGHRDRLGAPMRRATSSDAWRRDMAITRAPASLASLTSAAPRKPMPTIATVCPARMSLRRKMFIAQPNGSSGTSSARELVGELHDAPSSARSYWAKALPLSSPTRSPDRRPSTPSRRRRRRPSLRGRGSRLGRELHPFGSGPWRQIRGAHAAPCQPHANLPRTRLRNRHVRDVQLAGAGDHRGTHQFASHGYSAAAISGASTYMGWAIGWPRP